MKEFFQFHLLQLVFECFDLFISILIFHTSKAAKPPAVVVSDDIPQIGELQEPFADSECGLSYCFQILIDLISCSICKNKNHQAYGKSWRRCFTGSNYYLICTLIFDFVCNLFSISASSCYLLSDIFVFAGNQNCCEHCGCGS